MNLKPFSRKIYVEFSMYSILLSLLLSSPITQPMRLQWPNELRTASFGHQSRMGFNVTGLFLETIEIEFFTFDLGDFLELFNRRLRKTRYKNRLTFTTTLVFSWWMDLRSSPFRGAQGSSEEMLQKFWSTSYKWRSCWSSTEDRQILHLLNCLTSIGFKFKKDRRIIYLDKL